MILNRDPTVIQIDLVYSAFVSAILILMPFCDVLVTSRLTTELRDVHYNKCLKERAGYIQFI